jgi:hypothetical protein
LAVAVLLSQGCAGTDSTPSRPASPSSGQQSGRSSTWQTEITVTPKNPNAPQKLGKPDVSFDAVAWYNECKQDPVGSYQKYKDKVIEVTGTVSGIRETFGHVVVGLEVDPKEFKEVQCFTADPRPWLQVAPGSRIKVKGKVPEVRTTADLGSVVIVEAGTSSALTVTAAKLAGDYRADRKAAVAMYNEKWAHLEGEIVEAKGPAVTLKGEKDVVIVCVFGIGGESKATKALRAGMKAKFFGQLGLADREEEKTIGLQHALLTEPR